MDEIIVTDFVKSCRLPLLRPPLTHLEIEIYIFIHKNTHNNLRPPLLSNSHTIEGSESAARVEKDGDQRGTK